MASQENHREQEPFDYLTLEPAEALAKNALMHSDYDEPDHFVRALVPILDRTTDPRAHDALAMLIDGAFSRSIAFNIVLDDYLDVIRKGDSPDKEWRERKYGKPQEEAQPQTYESQPAAGDATDHEKVIRAGRFELVDKHGRVRAALRNYESITTISTVLNLFDEQGNTRVQIDLMDGDDPLIALYDRPNDNPGLEIDAKGLRLRDDTTKGDNQQAS